MIRRSPQENTYQARAFRPTRGPTSRSAPTSGPVSTRSATMLPKGWAPLGSFPKRINYLIVTGPHQSAQRQGVQHA